jgi:hypothetical protein
MTPNQFVETLNSIGINAFLENWDGGGTQLPTGILPNGEGWIMADEADAYWVGPDEEMPKLHLQFYKPASEDVWGENWDEPTGEILSDVDAETALKCIIRKALATMLKEV